MSDLIKLCCECCNQGDGKIVGCYKEEGSKVISQNCQTCQTHNCPEEGTPTTHILCKHHLAIKTKRLQRKIKAWSGEGIS